jgi:hypothetical protein
MPETADRLGERLSIEGYKTVEFFRAIDREQMECTVYTEGSCWSVRQVLAHIVSAEHAFTRLIEDVLGGGHGAPEGFEIDRFNEREVAGFGSTASSDLLQQFELYRRVNVELVSGMIQEDLSRVGRHPFLGLAPLEDIVKLLYRHIQIHQRDVRRMLAAGLDE